MFGLEQKGAYQTKAENIRGYAIAVTKIHMPVEERTMRGAFPGSRAA
jgi:hypothetical protein